MIDTLSIDTTLRELAHRVSGGITVTLYWNERDDGTSVEIFHAATEQTLHFSVPQQHALDAFYHPFAHVPTPAGEPLLPSSSS